MGLNGSIEGSNPSFSVSAAPAAVLRAPAEGWQSGRMRRSRKPLSVVRRIESSNLSPSAPWAEADRSAQMLRFGLIGTGYWASEVHGPGIAAHPQTELAGVWGRDPGKAATLAARFGAQPFSDVDELIAAVDAVAFSVPPDVQGELAVRAAESGRALLLEKPLALSVAAADRVVEAVRAPTVVFFTSRFDPEFGGWFRSEVDGRGWDGGSVLMLASIFEPGNPFGESKWRRERGALWDIGPHALALLLPTLGPVVHVEAVRGHRDEVHLALRHATGAASSVTLSLTARAQTTEVLFWGGGGIARMPEGGDVAAAYAGAIDALLAGDSRFDASFARDVVRVLASATNGWPTSSRPGGRRARTSPRISSRPRESRRSGGAPACDGRRSPAAEDGAAGGDPADGERRPRRRDILPRAPARRR